MSGLLGHHVTNTFVFNVVEMLCMALLSGMAELVGALSRICARSANSKKTSKQNENTKTNPDVSGNLRTWEHRNLGTWELGNLGTWELGNLGTWELGNSGTRELGKFGTWELGNLGTCELGNLGTWEPGNLGLGELRS